ncbi:intermediate filament protein ifa-1 [Austrofundulus limnaeus]|uniref:Intermediate filament protein ifa-1 n=1 Tax=Austrofundulus limnaeus TaxID=52670 RepID=A0A2I4AKB9_AUSLI|nr:PREDICTED: intermediate filament protein ifa-1-like [Austrofundulus limnaeus]
MDATLQPLTVPNEGFIMVSEYEYQFNLTSSDKKIADLEKQNTELVRELEDKSRKLYDLTILHSEAEKRCQEFQNGNSTFEAQKQTFQKLMADLQLQNDFLRGKNQKLTADLFLQTSVYQKAIRNNSSLKKSLQAETLKSQRAETLLAQRDTETEKLRASLEQLHNDMGEKLNQWKRETQKEMSDSLQQQAIKSERAINSERVKSEELKIQIKRLKSENEKIITELQQQTTISHNMTEDIMRLELSLTDEKFKSQQAESSLEHLKKYIEEQEKEWNAATTKAVNTISLLEESLSSEKLHTNELEILLGKQQEETQNIRAALESLQKIMGEQEEKWEREKMIHLHERREMSDCLEQETIRFQQEFNPEKAEQERVMLSETKTNSMDEVQTKDERHKQFEENVLERKPTPTQQTENKKPKKPTWFKWFKRKSRAPADTSLPPPAS